MDSVGSNDRPWNVLGWVIDPNWLSEAMWPQRTLSTLVQIKMSCPMTPSHYLNHCWLTTVDQLCLNISILILCLKFIHLKWEPYPRSYNEVSHTTNAVAYAIYCRRFSVCSISPPPPPPPPKKKKKKKKEKEKQKNTHTTHTDTSRIHQHIY